MFNKVAFWRDRPNWETVLDDQYRDPLDLFLSRFAELGQIKLVRELRIEGWFKRRVVSTDIDIATTGIGPALGLAVSRQAGWSGTVFFVIEAPMAAVQMSLIELGFKQLPSEHADDEARRIEATEGFDELTAMLSTDAARILCCFNNDGQSACLFG